jgi:uncharacterized damage-inducible protein DinB
MFAEMPTDALVSLMLHKAWADEALLGAAGRLPWLARLLALPLVVRIVGHFHAVDCIFRAHLTGEAHGYASAHPSAPSTLAALAAQVRSVDGWYVAYARGLDAHRARESLRVTFTDGDRQSLTRTQMLLHVALHGAYHRGNVDVLLRLFGAGALPDRLTSYLAQAELSAAR